MTQTLFALPCATASTNRQCLGRSSMCEGAPWSKPSLHARWTSTSGSPSSVQGSSMRNISPSTRSARSSTSARRKPDATTSAPSSSSFETIPFPRYPSAPVTQHFIFRLRVRRRFPARIEGCTFRRCLRGGRRTPRRKRGPCDPSCPGTRRRSLSDRSRIPLSPR